MSTYRVRFVFRSGDLEWREAPSFSSVRQVVTWAFDQISLLETCWPPVVEFTIFLFDHDTESWRTVCRILTRPEEV